MRFIDFKEKLKMFPVFSLNEIRKIDSNFQRRRLNEWQQKGYIKKVIRRYYIFSDLELKEDVLFEIANQIYKPSYISLEIALAYYSFIPENVYLITSVSSRKTYQFVTSIGTFTYRKIKSCLFFGYNLIEYDNRVFKIASPEKAILDYLYLNPQIKSEDDFESLRINPELFWKHIDEDKLLFFLEKFAQNRLTKTINSFLGFMKNA